ncbi:MAG: beta-lactamase family protein [Flavobacteriales bacterium]|nr:beta-lactamase family protein [Flavobacteriales bacterium]
MQKDLAFVGKLIVTKKMIKKQIGPMYEEFGSATIDTVTYSNKYHYRAQLSYEKDPLERGFLSFFFNSKGKVTGFGDGEPSYIYPKAKLTKTAKTAEERILSIINEKHLKNSTDKFNGSVLVMDQGKEIVKKSFGFSDFEKRTPLNEHTRFDLASCSKQFTAMAIMILEEQGKLSYSDNVKKYIPELPYDSISIEHLLTHTSGLPSYQRLVNKEWDDKRKYVTNNDIVDLLKEHQPDVIFKPNKSFRYSNTGYVMLAIIVERVSGISFANFLAENIFSALGMNDTRVYNTKRSKGELIDNFAHGYIKDKKSKEYILPDSSDKYNYVIQMDPIVGDGAICSSIHDLALWSKASKDFALVDENSWKKARTKLTFKNGRRLGYGYGLFLRQDEGIEEVVYHTGGWPGYVTMIIELPEQEKTVVILSNNNYRGVLRMADDILITLLTGNE